MSVLSVLLANGDNLLLTIIILVIFGLFVIIERKQLNLKLILEKTMILSSEKERQSSYMI